MTISNYTVSIVHALDCKNGGVFTGQRSSGVNKRELMNTCTTQTFLCIIRYFIATSTNCKYLVIDKNIQKAISQAHN